MSYNTQLRLMRDNELLQRVAACAAVEGVTSPESWAHDNRWALGAQPGWDAAYSYAIEAKNAHPGEAEDVISDAMILAGVQAIITAEAPTTA